MHEATRKDADHQHTWTDSQPELFTKGLARCTICGLTVPRNQARR